MSINKSQVKMVVVSDIGSRLDDMLEAALGQQHQTVGARAATVQMTKSIKALLDVVEHDFEKGEFASIIAAGELAVLKMVKTYLSRAISACEVTSNHFAQRGQIAVGKVEALQQSVKMLKKMHDVEQSKLDRVNAAIASGDLELDGSDLVQAQGVLRPAGIRPNLTLKQRRIAEESDKRVEGNGQAAEQAGKKKKKKKTTRKKTRKKTPRKTRGKKKSAE